MLPGSGTGEGPLLFDERRDILGPDDPLAGVAGQRVPPQAQLDGAAFDFGPEGSWSGSHWSRTEEHATASFQASWLAYNSGTKVEWTASFRIASKAARLIHTARTTSWPSLVPQPERYIIHRKFGLTQLMRSRRNRPPK
jgi:hypothetical protein